MLYSPYLSLATVRCLRSSATAAVLRPRGARQHLGLFGQRVSSGARVAAVVGDPANRGTSCCMESLSRERRCL